MVPYNTKQHKFASACTPSFRLPVLELRKWAKAAISTGIPNFETERYFYTISNVAIKYHHKKLYDLSPDGILHVQNRAIVVK